VDDDFTPWQHDRSPYGSMRSRHGTWPPPDPATIALALDDRDRWHEPPRPPRRRALVAVVAGALGAVVAFTSVVAVADRFRSTTPTATTPATASTPATSATASASGAGPATSAAAGAGSGPASTPSAAPTTATPSTQGATSLDVGVVDIDTVLGYQQSEAAGTGIVLTSSGEILTNNHVIDGATKITVTVVTTGKSYTATVVGTDKTDDVAVLQVKGAPALQPASIGDSSKVQVGDAVTAVGNALGRGGAPAVTRGSVTALDQPITATDSSTGASEQLTGLIQMDATLRPGDSGGPLYDANGKVIGIDTAGSTGGRFRTSGVAEFAIPINKALSVAKQIEAGQASDTVTIGAPAFLGVEVDPAAGTATGGVLISGVVAGTPAASLGLKAGDVVTALDGTAVTADTTLGSLIGRHHPGDKVTVTWRDTAGTAHTATAALIEGAAK